MTRPARYDVLFEPVRIGPVVAKNRFYQVPHCNGMGRAYPSSMAAMRGVKAEGGWGVVCTEQCDVHYSGAHQRELRLWDTKDVPYMARATDQIHEHGALAGVELVHNGSHVLNLETRTVPIAPSPRATKGIFPVTARAMDASDIRAYRRWHREAALNARRAGFDIVYVYAGHEMSLPLHFLSRRHNQRTDEYGGSLANRARLLRELVEDAKEAVGDTCAVAIRFGVDGVPGPGRTSSEDEARDVVEMLAELPDLWDVNLSNWDDDGKSARFSDEGHQEPYVKFVRTVTSKPVVGVGRFTSPDAMVAMITGGTLDLIGAARPSIADPFLPRKIEQGRFDDIRECIGCNVCVAWDKASVPIRCTQNPTMGEEWRRGWHSECSLIAVATGASWRADGIGRYHSEAVPGLATVDVYTPDDVMAGRLPAGRVLLYDDDHYYMGGVLAERLVAAGCAVTFVTPEPIVSAFTQYTTEQRRVQRRVMESCVGVHLSTTLTRAEPGVASLACVYTGRETVVPFDAVVLVTGCVPRDRLYHDVLALGESRLAAAGIHRVVRIGDCLGPGIIAAAVHSGHLFARTLDTGLTDATPFRRENVELDWDMPLPPGGN